MGSFNKIGFISNTPIEYKDPVMLQFMKFNEFDMSGNTYPTDMLSPYFLPIFGKYDMYGRIQDIQMSTTIKYIQDFFGEDIKTIIEKMDDNCVGRGEKKHVNKNDKLFQQLTFGLEHYSVYEKMAIMYEPSINDKFDSHFWLKKFGFEKYKSDNFIHYQTGMKVFADGWEIRTNTHTFHSPLEFKEHLETQGFNFDSLDHLIEASKSELSYLETIEAIDEFERLDKDEKSNRIFSPYREKHFGLISNYLTGASIDGDMVFQHGSKFLNADIFKKFYSMHVIDFMNFHMNMRSMNLSYMPSNYGNQSPHLEKYYHLNRTIRSLISDKVNSLLDEHVDEEFPELRKLKIQMKKDERSDTIKEIMK